MKRENLLYGIGIATAALGAAEIVLRLKDRAASRTRFHRERWTMERPWERFDPCSGWELIPGFVSGDIRINHHGFRGPELIKGDMTRILCLGDATTFGPSGEKNPYPQIVQTMLAKRRTSRPVEVINAGVCGHSTSNMIFRIQHLLGFKPDIVIVYAGWNDLFNEPVDRYCDNRLPYSSYWHTLSQKNIRFHLAAKIREIAGYENRKPIPLTYTPDEFVPFNFEYNLSLIISEIRKASALPVLLTLPKLIPDSLSRPDDPDISAATLPDFIEDENFGDFLKVYHAYDTIIRQIATETDTFLFDAAAVFETMKKGRAGYFEDTRHLTPEGYRVLGEFIAQSLVGKDIVQ
ncbi:GDSL-type esterase/lipase family protein [bacterium]|nr:GDSL-type esterase/lipase family protein [bacterium]